MNKTVLANKAIIPTPGRYIFRYLFQSCKGKYEAKIRKTTINTTGSHQSTIKNPLNFLVNSGRVSLMKLKTRYSNIRYIPNKGTLAA